MLSFLWHMISLAVIKSMFFIKKQSAILQLPLMVFILTCFQPSEEAWITPPLDLNTRSKTDGEAWRPPLPSISRPQLQLPTSGSADHQPPLMWKHIPGTNVVQHVPDSS